MGFHLTSRMYITICLYGGKITKKRKWNDLGGNSVIWGVNSIIAVNLQVVLTIGDLTEELVAHNLVKHTIERFGRIDVLVSVM